MKMRLLGPLLLLFLVSAYWWVSFEGGYQMEDSWFLNHHGISLPDLWEWFTSSRDYLDYYRPVRRIFFAVPNLFFPVPPPELYHALLLAAFLAMAMTVQRIYNRYLPGEWISWLTAFAFAVSISHAKPLFWLSASHNVFAGLLGVLAIYLRLRSLRWWALLCFFLAIASRESALGFGAALLWIEFTRQKNFWDFLCRSWEVPLLAGATTLFILSGEMPPVVKVPEAPGPFPLWINHWIQYHLVYAWPGYRDYSASLLKLPTASLLWIGAISFGGIALFLRQLVRREPQALFGWIWLGPLSIHLIYPLQWQPEYSSLAAIGFYSFWAQWICRIPLYRARFATASLALILSLFISWKGREGAREFLGMAWPVIQQWESSLEALEFSSDEVPVIRGAESFESNPQIRVNLIFLPQYLKLKDGGTVYLWDSEALPFLSKAYGLGVRDLKFARALRLVEGKTLVFLEEENLQWKILGREKIPLQTPQTSHGRSGWR